MNIKPCFVTVGRSLGAIALAVILLVHVGVLMYGAQFDRYINEPYRTPLTTAILGVAFGIGIGFIAIKYAGILAALFSAIVMVSVLLDHSQGYLVSTLAVLVSGLAPLTAEFLSRFLRRRSSRKSYPIETRKPENIRIRENEN